MPSMLMSSLLAVLFLANTTLSLQVSSNSPCTSLCLDNTTQNATSSSTSNTLGSDITCVDSDYAATPNGQRFMSCVSCLQTSTASDENGTDQEWFLYNLRFALDACLFGFQRPTDAVTTPCSMSESCQPLQLAIENGNLVPSNESEYSYCSVDDNAFLGASLNSCRDCLSNTSDEKYLRNFLTALQAGCVQQPPTGTIIGLEGSVFSTTPVNITFPGFNQTSSTPKATHKGGLPQAAIIGITVGLTVLLLITIAILLVYFRRRKNLNRMKKLLSSPLDSRFGAPNITAPTNGAYGNPYTPPLTVNPSFNPSQYTAKEFTVLDSSRTVLDRHQSPIDLKDRSGWYSNRLAGQLSTQTGSAIPTHTAYIPTAFSPISSESPTTSDATSDTYQMKEGRSARSSPKHIPPPLILEPKPPLHKKTLSAQNQNQIPEMRAIDSTHSFTPSPPRAEFRPQSQTQMRYEARNRSLSRPRGDGRARDDSRTRAESRTRADGRAESRNRAESRAESRTRADGRAESRNRAESRAESRTRADSRARGESRTRDESRSREMESSRVSPPGLHSQRMANIADEQYPSRSGSRADNYKRITVRPGISNTNASNDEPILKHGGRFDFELAERERLEKERMDAFAGITKDSFKKKKKSRPEDATPISAESTEEQWPGSY